MRSVPLSSRPFVTWSLALLLLLVAAAPAAAQATREYRGFALGSAPSVVLARTGASAEGLRTKYARPSLIQELEWRPARWMPNSSEPSTDPVSQITFSFVGNQLYRMVADYDRRLTEGMTAADLVSAVSVTYGTAQPRATPPARSVRTDQQFGEVLARWGNETSGVVLYRPSENAFRLVISDATLELTASRATSEALRLDEVEAPQRERERDSQQRSDKAAADAAARAANRGTFQP
jgi:hypothetical protein